MNKESYLPQNHEFGEHPTYTGEGCAQCGKPREGHKEPNGKPEEK